MPYRVALALALSFASLGAAASAYAQASAQTPTASETTSSTPPSTAAGDAPHEPTPEELAEARRVFAEGVAHADHGRWEQAAAAFERVLAVRPAPAVRFNLAAALVALGRFTEAEQLLDAVIADPAGGAFAARARALEAEMDQRGGHLLLSVVGADETSVVEVDGIEVPRGRLSSPLRVSAGEHRARVRSGDRERTSARVRVDTGETKNVYLGVFPDRDVVAQPSAPESEVAPRRERPRWVRNKWTWIGVGAGVAAIVTVAVIAATVEGPERSAVEGNSMPGVVRF